MEKTNVPGLYKNGKTIINTNVGDFNRIKATRQKAKEFTLMKVDIAEIKKRLEALENE